MSKSAKSEFPETGNSNITARVEGVRKFRQANPRHDYYPTADAAAAIERMREQYPTASVREVIDTLIVEGVKAFPEKAQ